MEVFATDRHQYLHHLSLTFSWDPSIKKQEEHITVLLDHSKWYATAKSTGLATSSHGLPSLSPLWMRMVSPRWSKDIADLGDLNDQKGRHAKIEALVMSDVSYVYLRSPKVMVSFVDRSTAESHWSSSFLDLSASSNLALSSAHAKGRSNSLESFVFDNLLLNVHKTHFQVGAPICQKCRQGSGGRGSSLNLDEQRRPPDPWQDKQGFPS